MNLTNARIGKLWNGGLRDVTKIARKLGRPGPAGEHEGLLTLQDRGEVTGFGKIEREDPGPVEVPPEK